MSSNNKKYSSVVQNVLNIYRLARFLLVLWIVFCVIYSLGELFYEDTYQFQQFNVYWPLSIDMVSTKLYIITMKLFMIVSKSLPIFFMLFYTILSFKASRVLISSSIKSLFVFWFVQAFNFVFILPSEDSIFQHSIFIIESQNSIFSAIIMLIVATPFLIYSLIRKIYYHKVEYDLKFDEEMKPRLPQNVFVALISIAIAFLFDINISTNNLIFSNGILFGSLLSLIVLPKEDLQKIMLFFISPDDYYFAFNELMAHKQINIKEHQREIVNRISEMKSNESQHETQAKKKEIEDNLRDLFSKAGKNYVQTKYDEIEKQMKDLNDQLQNKEIDIDMYNSQMHSIFAEIQNTYIEVQSQKIDMLPEPNTRNADNANNYKNNKATVDRA